MEIIPEKLSIIHQKWIKISTPEIDTKMKQPRDYSLRVTLSESELALLKAESERQGVPMTIVVRQMICHKAMKPEISSPTPPQHVPYTSKPEQILQGAMEEFLQHGYADTSMERVAATAGVSKQTLYSYFRDKEGLFITLMEWIAGERFRLLFCSQLLQQEPRVMLQQLATTLLDYFLNDQQYLAFIRIVLAESGRFPHLAQAFICNGFGLSVQTLKDYLASHPELKIADPEATARIFTGSMMSYVITMEVLHGKQVMPMASDRLIHSLINLIIPPSV